MKTITIGSETIYENAEHIVLDIDDEPVLLHFTRGIDDLLISSPDGDLLMSWKIGHDSEWDDRNCLLLSQRDNMKEIGGIKTSLLALKAKEKNVVLTVYITVQRN